MKNINELINETLEETPDGKIILYFIQKDISVSKKSAEQEHEDLLKFISEFLP